MALPDDPQQHVQRLQDVAAMAEAAALQLRQAAKALQAGHPLLTDTGHRLAQGLMRPLLPAPPLAAVPDTALRAATDGLGVQMKRLQTELVLLVFDRIDAKLLLAEAAIDADQQAALDALVQQVVDLVEQGLVAALDHERGGDAAANLGRVYACCVQRLLQAGLCRDVQMLREVGRLLAELRQGWVVIRQVGAT